MKTTVVRAFAATVAVALAFAIGHSAHPATAALAAQPECVVHSAPRMPTDSIPIVRGVRMAI